MENEEDSKSGRADVTKVGPGGDVCLFRMLWNFVHFPKLKWHLAISVFISPIEIESGTGLFVFTVSVVQKIIIRLSPNLPNQTKDLLP